MDRRPTAVDAVAERYLETFAELDPCAATEAGITGHDDDITDYSPAGVAARVDAARSALRDLDAAVERLRDSGVRFRSSGPVLVTSGPNRGRRAIYAEDPDGNAVEFVESTEPPA